VKNFKKILFLFSESEKKKLLLLSTFVFFCIFLEMLSLAIIVPVFNIIFLENSSLFNSFFNNLELLRSNNFKILLLIILIFIFFLKNIFLGLVNLHILKFYNNFQLLVSNKLFLQYLNKSGNIVYDKDSKNLLRKIVGDSDNIKIYVLSFQNLIIESFFLFTIFLLLFYYNYKITAFCTFIFFSIIFIYVKIFKKRINLWSNIYQESLGEVQNVVIEGVRGIKDIIIYNFENYFFNYFNEVNKKKTSNQFKLDFINNTQRFWMEIIAIFGMIVPLIIYIYFSKPVNELIPVFALFAAALFRILPSFNRMISYYNNIKFYQPSLEAIYIQFLNFNSESKILDDNYKFEFKKNINIKRLSFSYNKNSSKIFDGIDLNILRGSCVLILGDNGSGKSSFLNIMSGLLKPDSGQVLIDDRINIDKIKFSWLKKISYVQQDIFLLNKTIKENILLNSDDNDFSKFNNITELLLLKEAFEKLPNKLDTRVGPAGINLSGGQRQLISIARALYKDGEVFLFDEPTSALDYDYQKVLKRVINYLKSNNKTILIITHDLDLFKEFSDSIYKIEHSKIIKQL
jgi:ABC-type multidrug transport system fused ATPase/permease subunit